MTIYLASDHGGLELKNELKKWLIETSPEKIEDLGAYELDPNDDYPDFAFPLAEKVAADNSAVGILLCRSGGGMVIAANKVAGIRAVFVSEPKESTHAKEHNNANIISIGADWTNLDVAKESVEAFLKSEFTGGRHSRRLDKITQYEQKNKL